MARVNDLRPPHRTSMAAPVTPHDILRDLRRKPHLWLGPAAALTVLAVLFAVFKANTWEAAQAMIVRAEVSVQSGNRQPTSSRADDLKTAQETILELARSPRVLKQAMLTVGPDPSATVRDKDAWPTEKDIEEFADVVKITPPKGAEFGKTDIFYLKTGSTAKTHAVSAASALAAQVQQSYEELRRTKAASLIAEMERAVGMARADLEKSTVDLAGLEHQVGGGDLAELRILNELPSGNSDLRNENNSLESELRKEQANNLAVKQLIATLESARSNPEELVNSGNRLLKEQPALKRLKDGLVDAQLKASNLLGSMSAEHPTVLAAKQAIEQISGELHRELAIAVKGCEDELTLSNDRLAQLTALRSNLHERLNTLGNVRAKYANLVSITKHRVEILKSVEVELAEARTKQATAFNGSVIQLIGEPTTGSKPIGPGKTTIVLAGLMGGLLVGIGLVVLLAEGNVMEEESRPVAAPQSFATHPAASHPEPVAPPMDSVTIAAGWPQGTIAPQNANTLTFKQALEKVTALQ